MEQDNNQLILAQELIYNNQLPEQLKKFYEEFSGATPGDYIAGFGFGFDNIPLGPINITIDNTRISVVDTQYYSSSKDKNIKFITLQGYAQLTLFDRFYATCVLVGQSNPPKLTSIVNLVDHLSKTEEERE